MHPCQKLHFTTVLQPKLVYFVLNFISSFLSYGNASVPLALFGYATYCTVGSCCEGDCVARRKKHVI